MRVLSLACGSALLLVAPVVQAKEIDVADTSGLAAAIAAAAPGDEIVLAAGDASSNAETGSTSDASAAPDGGVGGATSSSNGCGCRMTSRHGASVFGPLALALAAMTWARRRWRVST